MRTAGATPSKPTKPARRRPPAAPPVRSRVTASEREALILQEAVKFFSEVGFSGDNRELARRANVTHPLLYKHFATKEALIERVYQEVYVKRWNNDWDRVIADESLPTRERMLRFYTAFSGVILSREWVRLFMFFGLRGDDINERWFALIHERVVVPFCTALRKEFKLPPPSRRPLTVEELELVQGISTHIFGFGVRQHIYGMPLPGPVESLVKSEIDVFFDGIGPTLRALVARR